VPDPLIHPLESVPLFERLDETAIALLEECAADARFEAGEHLFRQGDPARAFYVIRHGTVAIEAFMTARPAVTIETLGPGEALGWSWLFPPFRRQFDARALTAVDATAFHSECLRTKCDADPALGYELMSRFAQVLIERMQWTRLRLLDVYGDPDR
jgi:CRP/FNR family transcriptional regulator, cyclic AMP receptor protein